MCVAPHIVKQGALQVGLEVAQHGEGPPEPTVAVLCLCHRPEGHVAQGLNAWSLGGRTTAHQEHLRTSQCPSTRWLSSPGLGLCESGNKSLCPTVFCHLRDIETQKQLPGRRQSTAVSSVVSMALAVGSPGATGRGSPEWKERRRVCLRGREGTAAGLRASRAGRSRALHRVGSCLWRTGLPRASTRAAGGPRPHEDMGIKEGHGGRETRTWSCFWRRTWRGQGK